MCKTDAELLEYMRVGKGRRLLSPEIVRRVALELCSIGEDVCPPDDEGKCFMDFAHTAKMLTVWLRCALKDCATCPYTPGCCPGPDNIKEALRWLR